VCIGEHEGLCDSGFCGLIERSGPVDGEVTAWRISTGFPIICIGVRLPLGRAFHIPMTASLTPTKMMPLGDCLFIGSKRVIWQHCFDDFSQSSNR
jgi:hypothetical protein